MRHLIANKSKNANQACIRLLLQIQSTTRAGCLYPEPVGIVVSTGFDTTKGSMLKGMLAAPEHPLSFTRDGLMFIAVMLVAGLGFYAWSIVVMYHMGSSVSDSM